MDSPNTHIFDDEKGAKYMNEINVNSSFEKPDELADISTIDEMTLQLLTNHVQYKRYLSKSNPAKYIEKNNFLAKIEKYKSRISELTAVLLENPEKPITNEINDIFNEYTKVLCRYFEMKDLENTGGSKYNENYDYGNADDEDELFGNMDDNVVVNQKQNQNPDMNKFWSKKNGSSSFWSDVSVFRS